MSGMMESLKTVNSVVRTLLALTVVAAAGVASWFGYNTYYAADLEAKRKTEQLQTVQHNLQETEQELGAVRTALDSTKQQLIAKETVIAERDVEISRLGEEIQQKEQEIQRLDTAMRLLKVDHRLARITVLDAGSDADTGQEFTRVEFVEINDQGEEIDKPRVFRLKGDEIRVDCWLVKFDDKYIEEADLLRATTLCLFKSIYGNVDGPVNGYPLEEVGSRPAAYGRGSTMSDFEKKIWEDFWNIANNPDKARQMGIRAAHGQSNFTKAVKGKTYRLLLRASDGLTLLPGEDSERPTPTGETG
jgi:hypothetical protein